MLIRPAQPEDALAVARVHVRSWQSGYRDLLPQKYLDALKPEDRASRYDFVNTDPTKPKTFVVLEENTICGFATLSPAKDADKKEMGELCALYVAPDHWARGIGAQLLHHAHAQLAVQGYDEAVLWMLLGNSRAERFYQRHGWEAEGYSRTSVIWNITVNSIRYRMKLK